MIDTTSASGELVFHIFSALAQFERRLIQERTKAGLAAAPAFEVARSRIRENSGVFRQGQRPPQPPNSHEFGYSPSKCATSKAPARGRKGGRPRLTETEPRILFAMKLQADGAVTLDDIGKTLHMSRTTSYRYVRAGRKTARGRRAPAAPPPDGSGATGVPAAVVDTRLAAG